MRKILPFLLFFFFSTNSSATLLRLKGMGELQIAIEDEEGKIEINPAAVTELKHTRINLNYLNYGLKERNDESNTYSYEDGQILPYYLPPAYTSKRENFSSTEQVPVTIFCPLKQILGKGNVLKSFPSITFGIGYIPLSSIQRDENWYEITGHWEKLGVAYEYTYDTDYWRRTITTDETNSSGKKYDYLIGIEFSGFAFGLRRREENSQGKRTYEYSDTDSRGTNNEIKFQKYENDSEEKNYNLGIKFWHGKSNSLELVYAYRDKSDISALTVNTRNGANIGGLNSTNNTIKTDNYAILTRLTISPVSTLSYLFGYEQEKTKVTVTDSTNRYSSQIKNGESFFFVLGNQYSLEKTFIGSEIWLSHENIPTENFNQQGQKSSKSDTKTDTYEIKVGIEHWLDKKFVSRLGASFKKSYSKVRTTNFDPQYGVITNTLELSDSTEKTYFTMGLGYQINKFLLLEYANKFYDEMGRIVHQVGLTTTF